MLAGLLQASAEAFSRPTEEGARLRVLAPRPLRYLLVVSTVEPRKNHARLLAAWDIVRATFATELKLVVVGGLGWDYDLIMDGFRAAIDQGDAFFLKNVSAADLRVLYRHAAVTVCPSLAEGFDYSGIEAMRSGGIVVASDIPVHREIYADAAEYFDPYSTAQLADTLRNLLSPAGASLREHLRQRGDAVSARYLPEQIMPQWHLFFDRLRRDRSTIMNTPPLVRLVLRWHARHFVRVMYLALLERDADDQGLAAYCAELGRTSDLVTTARSIARSEEAWSKTIRSKGSAVVTAAFRGLLGRDPEAEALAEYGESLGNHGDLAILLR